ncbi:MAG: glycosyltransferase [Anaerolineae bacterium]|nr:glycosyltransferase [Anaerolineae bacterium]
MKPILSVVIVNYNTRDLLRACLLSLRGSQLPAQVIVVDNASGDGSAAMIRADFPEVCLLAQPENTWYCGGNNLGIAAATGDFVLLLNPDTVIRPDALARLVAFLQAHPHYAGATARLIYPGGAVQRTCSRRATYADLLLHHTPLGVLLPGWRRRRSAWQWYADWPRDTDADVEVVPGSCLLMRREELWLDDRLKLYFPEDDLARRQQRPYRFLAAAVIEHHEKSVTRTWLATRLYFRDLLIYTRRQHGAAAAALLWAGSRPLLWALWLKKVIQPA